MENISSTAVMVMETRGFVVDVQSASFGLLAAVALLFNCIVLLISILPDRVYGCHKIIIVASALDGATVALVTIIQIAAIYAEWIRFWCGLLNFTLFVAIGGYFVAGCAIAINRYFFMFYDRKYIKLQTTLTVSLTCLALKIFVILVVLARQGLHPVERCLVLSAVPSDENQLLVSAFGFVPLLLLLSMTALMLIINYNLYLYGRVRTVYWGASGRQICESLLPHTKNIKLLGVIWSVTAFVVYLLPVVIGVLIYYDVVIGIGWRNFLFVNLILIKSIIDGYVVLRLIFSYKVALETWLWKVAKVLPFHSEE